MNTIGQNQGIQPTGPTVQVPEQKTQLEPTVERNSTIMEEASVRDTQSDALAQAQAPRPKAGLQYLDPEQMREFVAKVSEAIRKASVEPYLVGFKPDPENKGYLIEIRKADGTLVTSFHPEKVLNFHGNLDDLSGMVIDRKT
jgi:uncharacterized FlaG/YvyC family protein